MISYKKCFKRTFKTFLNLLKFSALSSEFEKNILYFKLKNLISKCKHENLKIFIDTFLI